MLTTELVLRQETFPWRFKNCKAFVLAEAQKGDAVDTEHERRQGGLDAGHAAGGFYDACLQSGSVCDFKKRIDVVDIDLPEPEDLGLYWVQSRNIYGCLT